jgi:hypothetical protein
MRSHVLAAAAISIGLSACATDGGGPLGIVALNPNQHVAGAEPLFAKEDYMCLDKPEFLLSLYAPPAPKSPRARGNCDTVRQGLAYAVGGIADYDKRRRNEIMDALLATSEYKCGRYRSFLHSYDANINSTFGILAQAAAVIATVATGGTAQGFAAVAALSSGSRGTLNQAHFQNQAVGILVKAIENARATQLAEITTRQREEVENYTLMRGIKDVFAYHNSCSIIEGLKETQRAVEEVRMPSMATINSWLTEATNTRRNMAAFLNGNSAADAGNTADNAAAGNSAGNTADPATGNDSGGL